MDLRARLANNLARESAAYGFTLSVWGSGAMLIAEFGVPEAVEVFLFVAGAVGGFALLSALAFDGPFEARSTDTEDLRVASMVHVVATLGTLGVTYALTTLTNDGVPQVAVFAAAGLSIVVGYNLALLVEEITARRV
ncbi:hypothetical protein [Halorarius halobius]|uniref:hypothetical protein n=1 Tax=Halorarius halobius TaxID=2962671 RepID=UPI0020CBD2A7|nr:hypothetical protein [Halorarius halobius]